MNASLDVIFNDLHRRFGSDGFRKPVQLFALPAPKPELEQSFPDDVIKLARDLQSASFEEVCQAIVDARRVTTPGGQTEFGDLKTGDHFEIDSGVVFRKTNDRSAIIVAVIKGEPGHLGQTVLFGTAKPVTKVCSGCGCDPEQCNCPSEEDFEANLNYCDNCGRHNRDCRCE